jgi:hypothetical protein
MTCDFLDSLIVPLQVLRVSYATGEGPSGPLAKRRTWLQQVTGH